MIKPGRPSVSDEEMVTVAVKMPSSMVAAMDRRAYPTWNRRRSTPSHYLRSSFMLLFHLHIR